MNVKDSTHPSRTASTLILMAGATLRIIGLGAQSMWFDEAARLLEARSSLSYLLSNARQDTLPPFYSLTMHFWQQLGREDFWLRIPSVFANLLLIAVVYALARRTFDKRTAMIASLIIALFPYQVFHSQQANLYSLLALFSGMTILCFWQILHGSGRGWWAGYILIAVVGLYTHYYAGLLLLALHLFVLARFRHFRVHGHRIMTADALIFLALLPLTRFIFLKVGEVAGGFWLTRPSLIAPLSTLHLFTVSYSLPASLVPVAFFLTTLIVTLALLEIWFAHRRNPGESPQDSLIIILVFAPILLLLVVAQFIPIYLERTLIIVTPAYAILLARGIALSHRRSPLPYVAGSMAIVMVISLYHYNFNTEFGKPGYRQAAAYLEEQTRPGDLVLHSGNGSYIPFLLYRSAEDHYLLDGDPAPHHPPKLHEITGGRAISDTDLDSYERVWLVVALDHSVEYQRDVVAKFDASFKLMTETTIDDIFLRLYDVRT